MPDKKKIPSVKKTAPDTTAIIADDYASTIADLKKQIQESQLKAAISVNTELIKLYWKIGETIASKQENGGWGTAVIERLAKDLQNAFPGIEGFSRANIFYMRSFYRSNVKVQQAVGQFDDLPIFRIPWGHNILLLQVKDSTERLWYANKVIEHGWNRVMLNSWIKSDLYHREGKAVTNFHKTLPDVQSDVAHQTLKDPYLFDFLSLYADHSERELELGLIDHIQKFLLELGQGFAFVGRQVNLNVSGKDYYIDLLFYHTKLRCYCVIDLAHSTAKCDTVTNKSP